MSDPNDALRQHPDYAAGYFDALNTEPLWEDEATPEYVAGWKAAMAARETLLGAGFTQDGANFSKTTVLRHD